LLSEIEKKILDDVFEMQINNGPILDINNYDLVEKDNPDYKEKWSEFGSYLFKLRSLGYLKFEDKVLTSGGRQNRKYRNNIIGGWTEDLELDKDGIAFVLKERETLKEKLIGELKKTGRNFYERITDGVIGLVVGLIIAWLTGVFK
jgi:hypothetical protein